MDQDPPDAFHPLIIQLNTLLSSESQFQPRLSLPDASKETSDITRGIRDGSAHVLRCLKVWYDLPSEVLCVAVNLMDRFITKMKALPKHMACISVSAFHVAAHMVSQSSGEKISVPDSQDLVDISQCKCTLGDLSRMEGIILNKLSEDFPVTALGFLQLFHSLLQVAACRLGLVDIYEDIVVSKPTLCQRLEILVCDSTCANFRPSELALVLLCIHMNAIPVNIDTSYDPSTDANLLQLLNFAVDLQNICKITDHNFICCHEAVVSVLASYNAQCHMPHRQRLVWKVSQRTLKYLRPTDKLTSLLPTIVENDNCLLSMQERSDCTDADETCDWIVEDKWKSSQVSCHWSSGDFFGRNIGKSHTLSEELGAIRYAI